MLGELGRFLPRAWGVTLPCNAVFIPDWDSWPRVHAPTPYSEGFIQSNDKWIIPFPFLPQTKADKRGP